MGYDLGIGGRHKCVAFCFQPAFDLLVILNNAIVNDENSAGGIRMGMGVDVAGFTVRCPAGMTDSATALAKIACLHKILERLYPAHRLKELNSVLAYESCQARRVVAAVL